MNELIILSLVISIIDIYLLVLFGNKVLEITYKEAFKHEIQTFMFSYSLVPFVNIGAFIALILVISTIKDK